MSDTATNAAQITAEWIRRPLSDLGGISPEEAASDPNRRKQLDDVMTELAGHYVRLTNLGLPAVNPRDIRKALGLESAPAAAPPRALARSVKAGPVKRNALLDELGTALTGGDVDSVAFFNTKDGTIDHYMHNLGDQENQRIAQAGANPDFRKISPVTTEVRYGIMSDFISSVEDINVAGRLRSAISGKGAFRRFREAVDEDDSLRRRWLAYRTKRHYYLALDWMHKLGLRPEQFGVTTSDYDWQPPAAAQAQPPANAAEQSAPPALTPEQDMAPGASSQAEEQASTGVPASIAEASVGSNGQPPASQEAQPHGAEAPALQAPADDAEVAPSHPAAEDIPQLHSPADGQQAAAQQASDEPSSTP